MNESVYVHNLLRLRYDMHGWPNTQTKETYWQTSAGKPSAPSTLMNLDYIVRRHRPVLGAGLRDGL